VGRIAAGRQPPELTAQALRTGLFDIPVGWAAQERALGFRSRPEHAPINRRTGNNPGEGLSFDLSMPVESWAVPQFE
jgi:hypothetical protein